MEKQGLKFYHIVVVFCGILIGFVNMGNPIVMSIFLPFIKKTITMSFFQVSLLTTVQQLCVMCGALVMDKVYDNLGVRKGALIAFGSGAISMLILSVADNYALCLIANAFTGFCFGLGGMMASAMLMKAWFVKGRGLALGLCAAGSGLTSLILSVPISAVAKASSFQAAARIEAAIMVIGAVIFFLLVRDNPEKMGLSAFGEGEVIEEGKKKKGPIKPMSAIDFRILLVGIFFCGIMGFVSWSIFTMHSTKVGYDPMIVAYALSIFGAMNMIGKPLYGLVADLIGSFRANWIYFTLAIVAHISIIFADGVTPMLLYVPAFILGLCMWPITTVGYAIWAGDLVDDAHYASTLKKIQTTSTFAGVTFMLIPGIIADVTGSYKLAYIIITVGIAIALVILQRTYYKYVGKITAVEAAQETA